MRKTGILLLAVLAALLAVPTAQAGGLSIDKVVVEFKPGDKPIDNITITNQHDKKLRVTVQSVEVTDSDLPTQQEAATDKLVAAPKSFELEPGESRPVRLVLRGFPEDKEALYRVRFSPDQPTQQETQESGGTSVQVNVIVSMGALILVAPKNVKPDLQFKRAGDTITFTNAGNVTAVIQREEFCTEDKSVCAPLEGRRIYPGVSWDMKVPEALAKIAFSQTILINGAYSKLSYPAP